METAPYLTDAVAQRWPMVKSLIRVEHEVSKPNTQPKKETRYYISSLDFNALSAKEVAYYIREHWGIENRLHWQLDSQVHFSHPSPAERQALPQGATLEM